MLTDQASKNIRMNTVLTASLSIQPEGMPFSSCDLPPVQLSTGVADFVLDGRLIQIKLPHAPMTIMAAPSSQEKGR